MDEEQISSWVERFEPSTPSKRAETIHSLLRLTKKDLVVVAVVCGEVAAATFARVRELEERLAQDS